MKALSKLVPLALLGAFGFWAVSLIADAFWLPAMPDTSALASIQKQSETLVDTQLKQPGAMPTADELARYKELIDEANKVAVPAKQQSASNSAELVLANALLTTRQESYGRLQEFAGPYVGSKGGSFLADVVFGLGVKAASHRVQYFERRSAALESALRLRAFLRSHYAIALTASGDLAGAFEQVSLVLSEDPLYLLPELR